MDKQIVLYEGEKDVRLEVKTDGETVWLTQRQMCQLFGRERTVITKHINNIFKEGELEREVVCAKFAHTTHRPPSHTTRSRKIKVTSSQEWLVW